MSDNDTTTVDPQESRAERAARLARERFSSVSAVAAGEEARADQTVIGPQAESDEVTVRNTIRRVRAEDGDHGLTNDAGLSAMFQNSANGFIPALANMALHAWSILMAPDSHDAENAARAHLMNPTTDENGRPFYAPGYSPEEIAARREEQQASESEEEPTPTPPGTSGPSV